MNEYNFIENNFKTERSYDKDFAKITNNSGVYLIVDRKIKLNKVSYKILYVGSSKNLKQRIEKHEVYRILNNLYDDVIIYFKEDNNYLQEEKRLIHLIQPRFNKQWL